MPETTGIVFWNTWYRADPEAQLRHLLSLEEELGRQGVASALFCLSEATFGEGDGLVNRLEDEGFQTAFRPTSSVRSFEEGICFANRVDLNVMDFTALRTARAIANVKTRWVGTAAFNGFSVLSTHASYPRPNTQEVEGLVDAVDRAEGTAILGGDFNTVIGKGDFIRRVEESGLRKLYPSANKVTFPFRPFRNIGVELDHVFVAEELIDRANLSIYPNDPSSHNPLAVIIT